MLSEIPGRFDPDATSWMTELGDIFAELGISHYLNDFLEQGFDSWDTILDITESDFDALGVKLGHRRKLQRKIANSRGLSSDRALASPTRNTPIDERQADEQKVGPIKTDAKDAAGGASGAKRKYRRHPKPDENAPERPPSAYVIFSNKMREELKGRNLSFTEIAKLVGENWQNLSPGEKEPYEQQAFSDKERYNNELTEYKKTSNFREYSLYLAEFKARQSNQQQGTDSDIKRPKLEAHTSSASTGTISSGTSQYGGDTPTTRILVDSSMTTSPRPPPPGGHPSPPTQLSNMQIMTVAHSVASAKGSPTGTSPTVLPGYRESAFGGTHQALPWRDSGHRDEAVMSQQLPRITDMGESRSSYTGGPVPDSHNPPSSLHQSHRPTGGQAPPLLTPELTTRSSASSASTISSTFFSPTPRTPMEPSLDRTLPAPSLYSQKSTSGYDHQLPPLRAPSLSPQSSMMRSTQSPSGTHANVDFPTSIAPIRSYPSTSSPHVTPTESQESRRQELPASSSTEDDNLDPLSALLKAGEMVNRNSRGA